MGLIVSNVKMTIQPTPGGAGGVEVGQQVVTQPTVVLVSTADTVTVGQTNIPITGVGFGVATGTLEIQQDGGDYSVSQTVDVGTWRNYGVQFDLTQSGLRYGVTTTLKLTIA